MSVPRFGLKEVPLTDLNSTRLESLACNNKVNRYEKQFIESVDATSVDATFVEAGLWDRGRTPSS